MNDDDNTINIYTTQQRLWMRIFISKKTMCISENSKPISSYSAYSLFISSLLLAFCVYDPCATSPLCPECVLFLRYSNAILLEALSIDVMLAIVVVVGLADRTMQYMGVLEAKSVISKQDAIEQTKTINSKRQKKHYT